MKLISLNSSYQKYQSYTAFILRSLEISGRSELRGELAPLLENVRDTSRRLEDAEAETFGMRAVERYAVHQALITVRTLHLELASRGLGAKKSAPYTLLFPDGIKAITRAGIGQLPVVLRDLAAHLRAHLPSTDPQRSHAEKLEKDAQAIIAGQGQVEEQARKESLRRTAFDQARAALRQALERLYGRLVTEIGRVEADAFFPSQSTRKPAPPA